MAYDPYGYGYYDPYQGYGGEYYEAQPEEDTESQKLRKEQEKLEALESNRLYLKKVRKQCVKEDFADLGKTQLFLLEVLIEGLEVNTESSLGLVRESEEPPELIARVQFMNSPSLEIRDKGESMDSSNSSVAGQSEYMQTVTSAGLRDAYAAPPPPKEEPKDKEKDKDKEEDQGSQTSPDDKSETKFDTKWEKSNGKSCLFSSTALDMIQALDKCPVKIQVSRCVEIVKEERDEEEEDPDPHNEEEIGGYGGYGGYGSYGGYGEYGDYGGIGEGYGGQDVVSKTSQESKTFSCEPLGYAFVRLPEYFSLSILQSCKPGVLLPVSCVYRETCDLKNVFGVRKGELQVFVRLSSFGPFIITSFQSEGKNRDYVFKPSPLPVPPEEPEVNRDLYLKPILAEEGTAIGITVVKKEDKFQKNVVWKNGNDVECKCMQEGSHTSQSSMRIPRPSERSLCRDAAAPGGLRDRSGRGCDWHSLVGKEIRNGPGGNCGCMDSDKTSISVVYPTRSAPPDVDELSLYEVPADYPLGRPPSRVMKMMPKVSLKKADPIKGIMIKPEPSHCECDCVQMKTSLELKPMMKYNWHLK